MVAKPVTLSHVAAKAGVSLSTASKVLNGGGRVSLDTRQRILDAAEALDFRPNALAKFFATGKSHTVGVLTTRAPNMFAMPVLIGAQSTLGAEEMATLLYNVPFDRVTVRETVRKFKARQVDGVLVIGDGLDRPLYSVTGGLSCPVVYALGVSENPRDVSFTPDGRMVGTLATQHLLDIGRRRIVHVTGPLGDMAVRDRERGFLQSLAAAGLAPVLPTVHGSWARSWGVRAAQHLLTAGAEFDAVFCGNDQIATGMHMALRAAGRRIPDDVAVVGVDNMSGLLGLTDRLITTVDTNVAQLGVVAARYLLDADREELDPGVHYQGCSLIIGESTAGARDGAAPDEERYLEV